MAAIPRLDLDAEAGGRRIRLHEIPGMVPMLIDPIPGCAFAPRCPFATERCRAQAPPYVESTPGHVAACWEVDRVREMAA
jgi:peptide/nickel transport system ATP-binding protein